MPPQVIALLDKLCHPKFSFPSVACLISAMTLLLTLESLLHGVHSFDKYSLNIYHMPGIMLNVGDLPEHTLW